ncbi:MAG: hypothetical protein WCK05_01485 [Planctomycetota bacterium]
MTDLPIYPYLGLGHHPKVLTFYAGWTAQKICFLVNSAMLTARNDGEAAGQTWRQAAAEMDRLLLVCDAWRKVNHNRPWPKELARPLLDLVEIFADGGWWSSNEADQERSRLDVWVSSREEVQLFSVSEGQEPFFPRLNVEVPSAYEWVCPTAIIKLAGAMKLLGELTTGMDILRCGVRLSGLFHSSVIKNPQDLALTTLGALAGLDAVDPGACEAFLRSAKCLPVSPDAPVEPFSARHSGPTELAEGGDPRWSLSRYTPYWATVDTVYIVEEWSEQLVREAVDCVFRRAGLGTPPLDMTIDDCQEARKICKTLKDACASSKPSLNSENVFEKRGDNWLVRFNGGEEFHLKDRRGMIELAYLLESPGKTFTLGELVGIVARWDTPHSERRTIQVHPDEDNLPPTDPHASLGAKMDYDGIKQIIDAREELNRELNEAKALENIPEQERIQDEIDALTKTLLAAMNATGRLRHFQSPERKKELDSVRNRLSRVLNGGVKEHNVLLWGHLTTSLSRDAGIFCYSPDPPITWAVKK